MTAKQDVEALIERLRRISEALHKKGWTSAIVVHNAAALLRSQADALASSQAEVERLKGYTAHKRGCRVIGICQHDSFAESMRCDHDKYCTCGLSTTLKEASAGEGGET